jgi:threonine synthase
MSDLYSYLTHLECSECQRYFNPDNLQTYCPDCQAPILARYDLTLLRQRLNPSTFRYRSLGMWRWHEILPVKIPSNIVQLGEGDTPIIKLSRLENLIGLRNLYVKDESMNPTGTFKARGLSTAISMAKELGVKNVIIPTAGNAGGAMAAYAARGGLDAIIVMPRNSPLSNIEECRIAGATVIFVDGLINKAAVLAEKKSKEEGWFDISTFKEPYRVEGKKIMGFELAESFDWLLPDVIIYPTGGGTGLVGMWKAFEELQNLGWLANKHIPRMIAIQSEGCAPIIKAIKAGKLFCEFWEDANTIATGICVPKSFADKSILRILRESGGTALAVSDDEILEAQSRLAVTEGIFAAPEGAATLAGLIKLMDDQLLDPEERIVLFNTGTGLKYIH